MQKQDSPSSPYLNQILEKIPQVLSLIDRNPISPTYGCGDRLFWAWKFVDFPGSRHQEIIFFLSWLLTDDSFPNPFFKNPQVLKWIEACFSYWAKVQYRDGSFDEAYPFEKSLAAVAFSSFYCAKAFLLVEEFLSDSSKNEVKSTLRKSAEWLNQNEESHGFLTNHVAAAAAALWLTSEILQEPRLNQRAHYFIDRIIENQSSEGWLNEYGGADPGYQTHGSYYLSEIYQRSQEPKILESLKKANEFIQYFVAPDGSLGGEYASRNTMFFYPASFEILKKQCPYANSLSGFFEQRIQRPSIIGPGHMDAQNLFPVLNNFIAAHMAYLKNGPSSPGHLFFQQNQNKWFPKAGLLVVSTNKYYAIVGGKKGGVLKVWDKEKQKFRFLSCGYFLKRDRSVFTTQSRNSAVANYEDGILTVTTSLTKANQLTMDPYRFLGFRTFNLTFGRMTIFSHGLKKLLVQVLIAKRSVLSAEVVRRFAFGADSIEIKDNSSAEKLQHEVRFTSFHMGSSNYCPTEEELLSSQINEEVIAHTNGRGLIENMRIQFK